jgi:Icc protein
MPTLRIDHPEIFGVTETSVTVHFDVVDEAGPVDAPARVRLDGELRATLENGAGTRTVVLDGLAPGTTHRVTIEAEGAAAEPDDYFPESFETLPASAGPPAGSFATLNDLHFGEPRFGGTLTEEHEYGDAKEGFPAVSEHDGDVPYWRFMNEDAIADINAAGVDATIIKGDIADRGRPEQFEAAREAFARLTAPHHAFLGNHDYYGLEAGLDVDGYALLGQPRAPRRVDLGGWRLLLLETTLPGHHHGVFPEERMAWLSEALDETRETGLPTLLFMHHHPVPPERKDQYPNSIGLDPEDSLGLFDLVGRHPQVRGALIGHTHRNRVRHYPASGRVPWIEVNCTKDYPGGWAHYRLFEDGSFRQEVRRTSSRRAMEHSARCRGFFKGFYKHFSLGRLGQRSFSVSPWR